MAKEKQLTRTMYVTKARLTVVDTTEMGIKPGHEVKIYGHYQSPEAILTAVKEAWAESNPNLIPLAVEASEEYKAVYEIGLTEFLAHAKERRTDKKEGDK